jgi:hypothetical protein
MHRFLVWTVAAVLAIALTGCSSPQKPSWFPCQTCKYRVDSQAHDPHPRVYCVIDGREADCRKNPPECPECAKAVQR